MIEVEIVQNLTFFYRFMHRTQGETPLQHLYGTKSNIEANPTTKVQNLPICYIENL